MSQLEFRRNQVNLYPSGILEKAYRQIRAQGIPLVKPGGALARKQEREEEVPKSR
jgi:hypothetical protein